MHGYINLEMERESITPTDDTEMKQGTALGGMEVKEMISRTDEKEILTIADNDQRDIITDIEHAVDREPLSVEINNQSIAELPLPKSSTLPLKQSKRLQMKKMQLQGQIGLQHKTHPSKHGHQSYAKVVPYPNKSDKRAPISKTCPVCERTFARATVMRRHKLTHTQDHNHKFKCIQCGKCFKDQYDWKRHQQHVCGGVIQTKDRQYWINGEHREFISEPQITSPSKAPSTRGTSQKAPMDSKNCSLCGRFFARSSDMVRHMRSHSEERPHQCVCCEKRFKYSYDLKRHQRDLCKKMNQVDSQDVSQISVQHKVDLQPENAHSVGSSGPHATAERQTQVSKTQPLAEVLLDSKTCSICGRILTRTSDMARHLKSHSKERPYHCVACERTFKYKDTLGKHQQDLGHEGILEDFCQAVDHQVEVVLENQENVESPPDINTCIEESNDLLAAEANDTDASTSELKRPSPTSTVPSLEKSNHGAACSKECTVCGKVFATSKLLERHMISHSDDHPYRCSKCGKSFKYIFNLKLHQKSMCKRKELERAKEPCKCDECGMEFKGSPSLRIHQRTHNPLHCTECGRILPNPMALTRHKLMHKTIQCTMCEKSFTLLGRLREHYLLQHKFVGPYPCSHCQKTFTQLSYLVIHERVHSGEYPYQCSQCPKKLRTANSLTIHMRKHTGEKPFLCWLCGKSYRAASELSVHMGTHSEEKPFSCSQCDMCYKTKIQLNTHIEQVHIGVRYTCPKCEKMFLTALSLKRHELTHTGERPYPCSHCDKCFFTSYEMKRHERYHTGERPYRCEDCGKAFIQSGFLTVHRRMHTNERPFICNICDKRFRFSHHMKRHKLIHTGEKPFVCGKCGAAFTRNNFLRDHQCASAVNES